MVIGDAAWLKTVRNTLETYPIKEWLIPAGWAVVKGVLSPEKAKKYEDDAYAYVESFGMGFDRNDRSTWLPEKMPYFFKGGLFYCYGVGHEQFIWDVK